MALSRLSVAPASVVVRRHGGLYRICPPSPPCTGALESLTEREHEVLTLLARGLSNSEIAEHLHLGQGTVKTSVSRLLSRLQARDRAQLVIAAYETGLVTPRRACAGGPGPA